MCLEKLFLFHIIQFSNGHSVYTDSHCNRSGLFTKEIQAVVNLIQETMHKIKKKKLDYFF